MSAIDMDINWALKRQTTAVLALLHIFSCASQVQPRKSPCRLMKLTLPLSGVAAHRQIIKDTPYSQTHSQNMILLWYYFL